MRSLMKLLSYLTVVITSLTTIVILLLPSMGHAQETGRYISAQQINIGENTSIAAGTEVNFLGVIDVTQSVAASGRFATFTYGGKILNADANLFYKVRNDALISAHLSRTFDSGGSATICSALVRSSDGEALDFLGDDYAKYFEITSNDRIVDAYSISRPKNVLGWYDQGKEFCISGLSHSTSYKIKIQNGLKATRNGSDLVTLNVPIQFAAKTPQVNPSIETDGSKTILTMHTDALIPMSYVNVNEVTITLHKIDLASLTSYDEVFSLLNENDIDRLDSFWGDKIAERTMQLDGKLNEQQSINVNFSDILKGDQSGLFVATFSSPELKQNSYKAKNTQWFSISDISVQMFKGLNTTDMFFNSFKSAEVIAQADVRILARNNRELFSGSADDLGRVSMTNSLISGSGGFAPEFIIVSAEDYGTSILKVTSLDQKPRFMSEGEVKAHKEDVYLTSDRKTFRAGEIANIFGVVRALDLSPSPDQDLTMSLINRNDDAVYKTSIVSNAFGAFSAEIPLKTTFALGRYTVEIKSVDDRILAQHTIVLEDFVPLTIEASLQTGQEVWPLDATQKVTLSGEYYSGGPAVGLKGNIVTVVRPTRTHELDDYEGYIFGSETAQENTQRVPLEGTLDENGNFLTEVSTQYSLQPGSMYEVLIEGTVFDVGGRANKETSKVALDTASSYLGLRSEFGKYASLDTPPAFKIAHISRSGLPVPMDGVRYTVKKIYYDYNWYYSSGWRWNAVRIDGEAVESGVITDPKLTLKSPLSWGRHEIIITNKDGFETVQEFYVGWGSDTKPASEPEELVLNFTDGNLRGTAPFAGKLSILIADQDITKVIQVSVPKGEFEQSIALPEVSEPGVHILATLIRPIERGSEHLPQLAMGKTWVPTAAADRVLKVDIITEAQIGSTSPIEISLDTNAIEGNAIIFLIDEGIHALSGYKNKNLADHFLGERALNYDILTNFGELISQDASLSSIRVGGDDDMIAAAMSVDKSEFFKTVALASPLLEIKDGSISHTFAPTSEWEGRIRAVVFVTNDRGFGYNESNITVQDPVSIDVSMPRFVTPSDTVMAKMNLRWNEYQGPIELEIAIGDETQRMSIPQNADNQYTTELPITATDVGRLPIKIKVIAGEDTFRRNYEIVARQASYPATEFQSVKTSAKKWLGIGNELIQPYQSFGVDLDLAGSTFSASLTPSIGVNLLQVVSELNVYPYGCVEQVSSKTRGLLALSKVKGLTNNTSAKLQQGMDGLLAKQKQSGAFGYWSRNSRVYERYQPYAVDTLQKLLPYAKNQEAALTGINRGLENLYRSTFQDPRTKLYAYGLLAKSGFEVTSRARYEIDSQLEETNFASLKLTKRAYYSAMALDNLSLAYWVAAQLNDTKRMMLIAERATWVLEISKNENITTERVPGNWFMPQSSGNLKDLRAQSARQYAHLLAEMNVDQIAPVFEEVIANTHQYLSQLNYRSTEQSAFLVALQNYQEKQSLAGTKVTIDGNRFELDASGSIPLTLEQLKWGFEMKHTASQPLYLNIKSQGQRRGRAPIDNGYDVVKSWYDQYGKSVDLSSGSLKANQGDLFTVVIEIDPSKFHNEADLLLTDLLPAGFEIEEAMLENPKINGITLDFDEGLQPVYSTAMDDRFIAHFDNRWREKSFAMVRYTVRAAYETTASIPDATVEQMYAPELNGRSNITRAFVKSK